MSTHRVAVLGLIAVAVLGVAGIIVLALGGRPVPDVLTNVLLMAMTALAAVLRLPEGREAPGGPAGDHRAT